MHSGYTHPRGQDHPRTVFTDTDILTLRDTYTAGVSSEELAQRYGISRSQTCRIIGGRSWAHLTGGVSVSRTRRSNVHCKVTPDQVRDIIARYESDPDLNKSALGREYGITRQQIHRILRGQDWPDITGRIDRLRKAAA